MRREFTVTIDPFCEIWNKQGELAFACTSILLGRGNRDR